MFPPRWAAAVAIVGGDMFLPPRIGIRIPGFNLDKDLLISVSALLACMILRPRLIFNGKKNGRRYFLLMLVLIVGCYFTVQTNPEVVPVGTRALPGLTMHDFFSMSLNAVLYWWPAFFLGLKLFQTVEDIKILCTVLTVGGIVYSFFIFIELKFSPQLNYWIYGFLASAFDQAIRGGGYRPTVFMRHGLNVALFMLVCLLAAVGLARARVRVFGISATWLAVYLAGVLILCHSAGALFNAMLFVPAMIFLRHRGQARLALAIAGLVFLYPLLRFLDLIPVAAVVDSFTKMFGEARSGSLNFRLMNESELLARAIQKPWFGWGSWGRQFLYYPWGQLKSVVDGEWIAVMGGSGVFGFFGSFGLLIIPILVFARKRLAVVATRPGSMMYSAAMFIGVAFVFDLVPNSGVAPYLVMMIGALAGTDVRELDNAYPPQRRNAAKWA
ncbi:MAG TPA: hypothetical protein VGP07_14065 [Polyangia bacterium]